MYFVYFIILGVCKHYLPKLVPMGSSLENSIIGLQHYYQGPFKPAISEGISRLTKREREAYRAGAHSDNVPEPICSVNCLA